MHKIWLVGCWVICFLSQLFKNNFVLKLITEERHTIFSTNFVIALFQLVLLISDCVFVTRSLLVIAFLSFLGLTMFVGQNFSSSIIINPMLCVPSSSLLIAPLYNATQSFSYFGDWVVNIMVVIVLGGSCANICTINDKIIQWQFQKHHIGKSQRSSSWHRRVPSAVDLLCFIPDVIDNIGMTRGWW